MADKKDYRDKEEVLPVKYQTWMGLFIGLGLIGLIPFVGVYFDFILLGYLSFFHKDLNMNLRNWLVSTFILYTIVMILLFIANKTFYFII